jgi:ArsR family transcriptional regulator, arsenate/arsenite/antimonite-responsive transcriptional repressor
VQDLSVYFRALSDRKRLRIAEYLARHEHVTVTQLGIELRMSQPLMSWHLRMLRRSGIVKTRRAGRQVLCSLNRRALAAYQRRVDEALGLSGTAADDIEDVPLPIKPARPA